MRKVWVCISMGSKTLTSLRLCSPWIHLGKPLMADHEVEMQAGIIPPVDADVMVFTNCLVPDLLLALEVIAPKHKIVWQIDDDFWHLEPTNPCIDKVDETQLKIVDRCLSLASEVWVTTQPLADLVGSKAKVLPNAIDEMSEFKVHIGNDILYAGGHTHKADLALIKDLPAQFPDRKFKFIGCCTDELLAYPNVEYLGQFQFEEYQDALVKAAETCSIGICPLADNQFNRAKSNLKYLEMANLGLTCICSPVKPYIDTIEDRVNGILVKDNDWVSAINSVNLEIAEAGWHNVKENWSWQSDRIKDIWKNAFINV